MVALRDRHGRSDRTAAGSNAAVAITDLRTGETIDVNGNDVRLPGCTINLFALIAATQTLQAGRYPEPAPGDLIGQTINRSDPDHRAPAHEGLGRRRRSRPRASTRINDDDACRSA